MFTRLFRTRFVGMYLSNRLNAIAIRFMLCRQSKENNHGWRAVISGT